MPKTLGVFLTWTTYGKWLRGDRRGWVDDGKVLPPNPELEAADQARLRWPPFMLPKSRRFAAGEFTGQAVARMGGQVYALAVASWHVHLVMSYAHVPLGRIVKSLKDAIRLGLEYRRAIWVAGYDKRFCFDRESIQRRIEYVRRHNTEDGLPPDPWDFIVAPPCLRPSGI